MYQATLKGALRDIAQHMAHTPLNTRKALKSENDALDAGFGIRNMSGLKKEEIANKHKAENLRQQNFSEKFIDLRYNKFKSKYEEYEQREKNKGLISTNQLLILTAIIFVPILAFGQLSIMVRNCKKKSLGMVVVWNGMIMGRGCMTRR